MGDFWSKESPPSEQLMETGWCEINWGTIQNKEIKKNLRKLQLKNPAVEHLHILVIGPVGAGKSSFIQSVNSVFKNRMVNTACTVAAGGKSCTKTYTTNQFEDERARNLPFVISDVMGLENGKDCGVQPRDIIKILEGHIKNGYTFNPVKPCSEEDTGYNSRPTVNDMVHCLVFVIPVINFTVNGCMDSDLIRRMQNIRQIACDSGIPHVVILTKVDLACPLVQEDIKHVYRSRSIHRKAQACSDALGVPMSCIFPVKNYHEEKQLNPDMDALLLFTLREILNYANDFVENMREPEPEDHRMRSMGPFYSL
ncbi:interferon-induced protein 44-like [Alosa sapidissima]|uniref:interferon-induced protein 44-like n=1 Tax=Alosa sapidissima TaxID=34773 RepID=UPI001C095F1D|nr:interferon-induced protein 44-like [Alosa sapidissima]